MSSWPCRIYQPSGVLKCLNANQEQNPWDSSQLFMKRCNTTMIHRPNKCSCSSSSQILLGSWQLKTQKETDKLIDVVLGDKEDPLIIDNFQTNQPVNAKYSYNFLFWLKELLKEKKATESVETDSLSTIQCLQG